MIYHQKVRCLLKILKRQNKTETNITNETAPIREEYNVKHSNYTLLELMAPEQMAPFDNRAIQKLPASEIDNYVLIQLRELLNKRALRVKSL